MSEMPEFGGDHAQISAAFLRRSRAYLANGELLQTSEKGWGAAAHALKLYAAARQLEYERHEQFNDITTELRLETRNSRIRLWASSANRLHNNFYSDSCTKQQIAVYLDDIANLVNLIRRLADLPPIAD